MKNRRITSHGSRDRGHLKCRLDNEPAANRRRVIGDLPIVRAVYTKLRNRAALIASDTLWTRCGATTVSSAAPFSAPDEGRDDEQRRD